MKSELEKLQDEVGNQRLPDNDIGDNEAETLRPRYSIGVHSRQGTPILPWLTENSTDTALQTFFVKLQDHLLRRLRQGSGRIDDDFTYSDEERANIYIKANKIYEYKTIAINFKTYDIRRDHDTITSLHPDIMLLSNEDVSDNPSAPIHPYWYARVLKIFHVWVQDLASPSKPPERLDVLWVRWFAVASDPEAEAEDTALKRQLIRVGYVPVAVDRFGFVDPHEVIQSCYLLPVREYMQTHDLLNSPSRLASDDPTEGDYPFYYVIHWVDRDMFMRYCGGGPGYFGVPTCSTAWRIGIDTENSTPTPSLPNSNDVGQLSDDSGEETGVPPSVPLSPSLHHYLPFCRVLREAGFSQPSLQPPATDSRPL